VSEAHGGQTLSMREMSARSGVSEGTLRMWEARHDFPAPQRLPSGHRRYSELDLKRVLRVVQAREQGLSLSSAIELARHLTDEPLPSVYAALRQGFPHLQPHLLPKRALLFLSHAIEDESCAHADRSLLFGCFQHERFYRAAAPRWIELARTAERAIALADFPRKRTRRGEPAEVPISQGDPVMREWVVVCQAPRFSACLVGFEPPRGDHGERMFETVWTVEAAPVREAARICCELTARSAPELVDDLRARLEEPLSPAQLRTAVELTTRMVLYAATASSGRAGVTGGRAR
jgi:MerR family transcriptional regulator, light-induced transcriptional regulator